MRSVHDQLYVEMVIFVVMNYIRSNFIQFILTINHAKLRLKWTDSTYLTTLPFPTFMPDACFRISAPRSMD